MLSLVLHVASTSMMILISFDILGGCFRWHVVSKCPQNVMVVLDFCK